MFKKLGWSHNGGSVWKSSKLSQNFDCNHLAHVIVLLHMQKFMCYCTVFALLYLNLRRVFCAKSLGGAYIWRGLFWEFYGIYPNIFFWRKCARDNPKGNMQYNQYTVPGTVAVEPTFFAFLEHSQTYVQGLSCHSFNLFLWRTVNSKPPTTPFGPLSRALLPTTFLEIAVCSCYIVKRITL